ncbi:MAG TPA: HAMP domain-containing sensor histidine kinase [Geodermatophilus sp.]|nr:HAMP domain-containing sensor histidine kinase [Geodermatophilus sp.]
MTATGSLRARLSWSATAVVALWVAVLTVGANVLLATALGAQADDVLRARAEAAAATVQVAPDGAVTVVDVRDDRALDVGTWIFAADGTEVEAPPGSPAEADGQAAALAARARAEETRDTGLPDRVRLLALPVREQGDRVATVVTSTSLTPYDQLRHLAGLGSAVLGALLLVIVHVVLRANVARALRPVREMTAQAGRWSADDVDRRFGDSPRPAELDELARTLDGVLGRLAAVLRHERQLSDELSHELRTPLARVQAEVDLLRERPRLRAEQERALAVVDDAVGSMRRILETLITTARSRNRAAPGRCAPAEVLPSVVNHAAAARAGLTVTVDVPPDLVVGVDAAVLERMAAPLLDNAVRYAAREVRIDGQRSGATVRLAVRDDGPGVPDVHRDRVFEPGWRADPGDGHAGAGLGLALARRLATAAGAQLTVVPGGSGARFMLDLPTG